jgi:hypothetical protein
MKRFVHKTTLLFTALLLLALALPISVLADGGSSENEFTQTVDGYQVTLAFEKPAAVGENQIRVLVKDAMSMPVSQADLEVSVVEKQDEHAEEQATKAGTMSGMGDMDAQPTAESGTMSGMSGMEAAPTAEIGTMTAMSSTDEQPAESHDQMGMVALEAGHESGEYDGAFSIESAGDLTVRVHLTVAGKLMEVDFPLHVAKSNTGSIVLGSFFVVNVALIAVGAVMKSKTLSLNGSKKA